MIFNRGHWLSLRLAYRKYSTFSCKMQISLITGCCPKACGDVNLTYDPVRAPKDNPKIPPALYGTVWKDGLSSSLET